MQPAMAQAMKDRDEVELSERWKHCSTMKTELLASVQDTPMHPEAKSWAP